VVVVDADREREIAEVARRFAGLGGTPVARVFALSWWSDHLLARAMEDPHFRARLFRFVDAFPALKRPEEVVDHLQAEFAGQSLPWWFHLGLDLGERYRIGRRLLSMVAARSIDRMARQFVAGTDPASMAAAAGRMWDGGAAVTVDLLGEHTYSDAEGAEYGGRLAALVEALGTAAGQWPSRPVLETDDLGPVPRVSVSVKISALSPAYHPLTAEQGLADAEKVLHPILGRASELGVQVWFDMEHYEEKALTHQLFRRLMERPDLEGLHAGIVVQAYLRDAGEDLEALARWAEGKPIPVGVRLVKGAYWDTESVMAQARGWPEPVHTHKADTDAAFEMLAQALHARHGTLRAAFASHNLRSLAAAVVDGRRAGVPDNGYELQLLYGMAEPVHEAVRRAGFRLRVYTPMGELVPGMAYLVRRLLENTSNESFVRDYFAEREPLEQLLAPPTPEKQGSTAIAHRIRHRRLGRARAIGTAAAAGSPVDTYRPEPPAQWHRRQVFETFAEALDNEFARPPRRIQAMAGWSLLSVEASFVSVDPAEPTSLVAVAASCGPAEVEAAVGLAAQEAERWRRRPAAERAEVLVRAAHELRQRRLEIAALEVREVGKDWSDADADVCEAIDYCEYYARSMMALERGGQVQSPPGERNRLRYRGRGVCAVIAPWNFPLAIPTGMTAAALVTGNAVVLKPAEQAPAVAAELVSAFAAAGLPDGILSFVPGNGEGAGAPLVAHPEVALIAFTGSRDVGLSIVETAARRDPRRRAIPKVVAELGGKNAVVVDDDADLDEVVPAVIRSAFGFAGQKCSAASRLIVADRIHDTVVGRVVEAARSLVIGPPRHAASQVGPVIDAEAHERLTKAIARAGEVGTPVLGRTDVPPTGYFVGPTVVTDVDPQSWLAQEELFGPVLAVFRVPDIAAGLQLANDSPYALTAGMFSRSPDHVARALDELRAGNVYVNRAITGAVVGRQPFGGNRLSGVGSKAGGPDYLLQFCDPQVTSENTVRQGFTEEED
jgi:RHH-type transcriptional regulator, proline utilization regulon repressor / proline dehydrogenase / delta 1-pyrroline-5-carboxylate dehydrogenase